MSLNHLKCAFKNYNWGSASKIHGIMGIEPDGKPLAEVWMGSHPGGMCYLDTDDGTVVSLEDYVARNPEKSLGSRTLSGYGNRLPYLFKLLCIEKPCSVQAHPDRATAEKGFERENLAGIPADSPGRIFKDPGCKNEMVLALTPFYLMNGFKPADEIKRNFPGFIDECGSESGFYSAFLKKFINSGFGDIKADLSLLDPVERYIFDRLQDYFPGDPFVYAPFFLNSVRLEPGEALAVGEGQLHSYVEGMCFELMTSSDNTLRGGLTDKYINKEELYNVIRFREEKSSIITPVVSGCERRFIPGFGEFALSEIKPGTGEFVSEADHGMEIIFVYSGRGVLCAGDETAELNRGEALVIPADAGRYTIRGTGDLAVYKGAVQA